MISMDYYFKYDLLQKHFSHSQFTFFQVIIFWIGGVSQNISGAVAIDTEDDENGVSLMINYLPPLCFIVEFNEQFDNIRKYWKYR